MPGRNHKPEDGEDIPTLTRAVETVELRRDNDPHRRHVKWLLTVLAVLLVVLSFSRGADDLGERYNDVAFKRALITFAVARGLNGLISVLQGTEVALQPAGLGVVFAPGQVFDPINDLIERFSDVMLLATTSLGLQKILIQISGWWAVNLVLVLALLLLLFVLWVPQWVGRQARELVYRLVLVAVFVRFAVPVVSIVNEHAFDLFLSAPYEQSSLVLDQARRDIHEINESEPLDTAGDINPGFFDRLRGFYQSTTQRLDIERRIEQYKDRLSSASEHAINLIVVFILQTVVFPVAFLLIGAALLRWLGRSLRGG